MKEIHKIIAEELDIRPDHVKNVIELLDEGNTIPFIARYRKEVHGSMDDTLLRKLEERLSSLRNLIERKETVLRSIEEQGALTDEITKALDEAMTLAAVEDIYRPYKQKRKTRASAAKEKGLEPLAEFLLMQSGNDPQSEALKYVDIDKGVNDISEALHGAMDIIAEKISDDIDCRSRLRSLAFKEAEVSVKAVGEEDSVYRQYYEFAQNFSKMKGYQVLAINRGEKEGFLKAEIAFNDDRSRDILKKSIRLKSSPAEKYLEEACNDSYQRLLKPSLERELRNSLTEEASAGAIENFAMNLKPLLMQPPVKGKVTMGLDPGYTHGCKVAVVDGTGKVLDTAVVYLTFSEARKQEGINILAGLIDKYGVENISIGNGTASRETEAAVCELLTNVSGNVGYAIVNEAGASVYSASDMAANEFPDMDVNLRSAVSIARRLQDPLAELVKIEPMAIGVGQYQHDMPKAQLEKALDGVVEDSVNAVGADINTASPALLSRVAGLTKTTAGNIVKYREENGIFKSRRNILKVPGIGPKAFEQCAGFLRVPESSEILDNTGVHPESYAAARALIGLCGYNENDISDHKASDLKNRIESIGKSELAAKCGIGVPTLMDIADELMKPGRDPREELPPVILRRDVLKIEDLKPGMKLKGTVRNVMDFGAFVDIGVHQDGLVHISQLADRFVKHPSDIVKVGDIVEVSVMEVDVQRKRISLSMKQ